MFKDKKLTIRVAELEKDTSYIQKQFEYITSGELRELRKDYMKLRRKCNKLKAIVNELVDDYYGGKK